jgi:2-methylisocitrate lyase-like PEP mutase family enzyme
MYPEGVTVKFLAMLSVLYSMAVIPDFVNAGRTGAFRTVSFAEGVRRSNLYVEAGADVIMPPQVMTGKQVKQLFHETHGPPNCVLTLVVKSCISAPTPIGL